MRSLVVAHTVPWPAASGGAIRLDTTLTALAELGPVDLVAVLGARGAAMAPVDDPRIDRVAILPRPEIRTDPWSRVRSSVARVPDRYARRDYAVLQREVAGFTASSPPDLVWATQAEPIVGLGAVLPAPVVTDLYDLEDRKLLAEVDLRRVGSRGIAARARAGRDRQQVRRWRMAHRLVCRESAAVVVCSDLDRRRLGRPADVVPNCYPVPDQPKGPACVDDRPTVCMIGQFTYPPNADAAVFAAREVLPLVRRAVPGARLRLVGQADDRVRRLTEVPGVEVTGRVDDLDPELAQAHVALVPIRFGSGTRVKILEAFAHRIPVVSTPIGAEGLGARDGVELLLGSDGPALAAACADLLLSDGRRRSLVERAEELWRETAVPAIAAAAVAGIARRAVRA